jgi:hypothetical protein
MIPSKDRMRRFEPDHWHYSSLKSHQMVPPSSCSPIARFLFTFWMLSITYFHSTVKGFPPLTPYIGTTPTLTHIVREKRHICCLQLAQVLVVTFLANTPFCWFNELFTERQNLWPSSVHWHKWTAHVSYTIFDILANKTHQWFSLWAILCIILLNQPPKLIFFVIK